jgi:hypothetical protein
MLELPYRSRQKRKDCKVRVKVFAGLFQCLMANKETKQLKFFFKIRKNCAKMQNIIKKIK